MNSQNVTAGKPNIEGAIFVAPLGSTLPTDAVTALDAAYEELGYASDAGLANDMTRTSTEIKAWGGDTVLNVQTDKKDNFTLTLIEAKDENVLKQVFGDDNVTVSGTDIAIKVNSKELSAHSWVINMILSGGYLKRIVLPNAQVTNIDQVSYADASAVGYGLSLSCLPDSSGNTHYEYISAGTASV